MRRPAVTAVWWVLCLLHLVPGVAGLLDPLWFAQAVAGVPTDTAHFARDVGVAELTLAGAAALAALRPSTRLPVAGILTLHLALHAVSHVVDRASASGQANALVAASLLLQALLVAVVMREPAAALRPSRPRTARGSRRP